MAQFPRTHNKTITMAIKMAAGITENPQIFPDCSGTIINEKLDEFNDIDTQMNTLRSQMAQIAQAKASCFEEMTTILKNQIKVAQSDTAGDPGQMLYLGIEPRKTPAAIEPPGSPGALKLAKQRRRF